MGWEWFPDAVDVANYLVKELKNVAITGDEKVVKRYNELAEKVVKFQEEYFSDSDIEDLLLGYAVVFKEDHDILVKAIIAYGVDEPRVSLIDIEEWLEDIEWLEEGDEEDEDSP